MKSLFLATAAVAAFAAAPAFAQDAAGSVGLTYNNVDVDVVGVDAEAESASIDAAYAIPVTGEWTVTLDGAFNYNIDGPANADNSSIAARVHGSRMFGNVRVAGFVGGSEAGDEQLWSFGGQAQTYLDKLTLTGSLAYETVDGVDADIWSVGADASYFINPSLRLNAGAGWSTADVAGADVDGWSANVGGEYQIAKSPYSVTANYAHSELEDIDLSVDTFMIGFRFSLGGDLQSRQRSGADLGRTAAGIGAVAGAF